MVGYLKASFLVWLIGFLPTLGIYIAIPVGFLVKLDPFSIAFWSIIGTYLPIPLIILFFDWFYGFPKIKKLIWKMYSKRFTRVVNKYGVWLILLVAPIIGAWTVGITSRLLLIDSKKLAFYSFISMIIYGIVLTVLIKFGIRFVKTDFRIPGDFNL